MKFKAIRELFSFTQKERYGIIALLCLIFILIAINISLPYFVKDKPQDTSKWESEVNEFLARQKQEQTTPGKREPVSFDPNKISLGELTDFGVPSQVASNWIKYLEKGGRFKKKEDVKKIYGMTSVLFDQLDKFILLPQTITAKAGIAKPFAGLVNKTVQKSDTLNKFAGIKRRLIEPVELNSADSARLLRLPGIGPILASRIIRYRNLLGGYYSVEQIHEVYGLREENYISASPFLSVDVERFSKFNINFASLPELGRHPYIGFKTARKILNLRDKRGKYSSSDDLMELMTTDSLKRLIPYLTFNQ